MGDEGGMSRSEMDVEMEALGVVSSSACSEIVSEMSRPLK